MLKPFLEHQELLTPDLYAPASIWHRERVLYADPGQRFSIVTLVLPPGQMTPIHDHIAWCVTGVYRGALDEVLYRPLATQRGLCLVPIDGSRWYTGTAAALVPPEDIHDLINRGSGSAVSLHIYGTDLLQLGPAVRRCYDLPIMPSMEDLAALDMPA